MSLTTKFTDGLFEPVKEASNGMGSKKGLLDPF